MRVVFMDLSVFIRIIFFVYLKASKLKNKLNILFSSIIILYNKKTTISQHTIFYDDVPKTAVCIIIHTAVLLCRLCAV